MEQHHRQIGLERREDAAFSTWMEKAMEYGNYNEVEEYDKFQRWLEDKNNYGYY